MRALATALAGVGVLALGACAVTPPSGPSFAAMPGQGKTLDQFRHDDFACRQYANETLGGVSPSKAATDSGIGSAAIGTALGAAAGALIGAAAGNPGAGAAIGAGAGLLTGTAAGTANAQYAGASFQQRYDVAYAQCMVASGETVPQPGVMPATGYAYAYPPPVVAYPYPYPYPYPAYYGPEVAVGFGFGGYHHWR